MMVSVSSMNLVPVMKDQDLTNAYNTTMAAMRLARDNAVAQRASYSVTFANAVSPSPYATVTVAPTVAGFQGDQNAVTYKLPRDVSFLARSGLPTASTAVPDGYGSGTTAIDFGWTINGVGTGGQPTVYFCPDGSSQRAPGTTTAVVRAVGMQASCTSCIREICSIRGRSRCGVEPAAFADGVSSTQ